MRIRPYQLPQKEYGFWFAVRDRLGIKAANHLLLVLAEPADQRRFDTQALDIYAQAIRVIAQERNFV